MCFENVCFSIWSTPINVVFAYCTFYIYRCICQTLHEKITVLVTHQLQYLKAASQILILKDVSNF